MSQPGRPRVMFLCAGNSCRSQMAEGWARHLHGERGEGCRAGTDPHGLNPLGVRAMSEAGVDISAHTSKTVESCSPETPDLVVTACGHARENCPVFLSQNPRTRVVHHGFDDPPTLAADASNDEQAMPHARRVRDEIRSFIESPPSLLDAQASNHGAETR